MYFHVLIGRNNESPFRKFNISDSELNETFIKPYKGNCTIYADGQIIQPVNVTEVEIRESTKPFKIRGKRAISYPWGVLREESIDVTDKFIKGPPGFGLSQEVKGSPIQLLDNLKQEVEKAAYPDKVKLEGLIQRTALFIEMHFGGSKRYSNILNGLAFSTYYSGVNLADSDNWNREKGRFLNLLDTMLQHIRMNDFHSNQLLKSLHSESVEVEKESLLKARKVFVVHGQDNEAKQTVARFLEKLEFEVIILHERPNAGKTLIEKFEHNSDVAFAVVLLTPDDIGGRNKQPLDLKPRARQNVVLELGYFIAKLGRDKVCILHKEGIERPTDISGVVYVSMDSGDWKLDLVKELENAGLTIDRNLM
jgi:hypothetical protein